MYDLIIIGAGPAGITASIYAARKRMNFLVISKDIGGQTTWSGDIENYTGYQLISGVELVRKFEEHLKKYNVPLKEGEEVKKVTKQDDLILVETKKERYEAKAVIIASGKRSKELKVPGEVEFRNKGLSYCATCDGPLFTDKEVAVIGGGNSALDATLQLINIAKHIYLINIAPNLTGDAVMQEKVKKSEKVSILNNTRLTAVLGDKMVRAININEAGGEEKISLQGVFVEIGLIPNSELAQGLKKNEKGEILVNCSNETSVPGIFAAGDVTSVPEKQIIVAAGGGATATLSAFQYLSTHE